MIADCLFCQIASEEIPADIVARNDDAIAFRDLNPQAPTHLLIVPKRHIPTMTDLAADDDKLVGKMILVANKLAEAEDISEGGFRTVFNCREDGGQEVYHLHLHVLGGRSMRWPPG